MKKSTIIIAVASVLIVGVVAYFLISLNDTKDINVIGDINDEKDMLTLVKELYNDALSTYRSETATSVEAKTYSKCKMKGCSTTIPTDYDFYYMIKINELGNITEFYVKNYTYQFVYKGPNMQENDIFLTEIKDLNPPDIIEIYPGM